MAVSSTSEMALRLKAREQVIFLYNNLIYVKKNFFIQADREEKARLKILTLNMSTRMEQQENEQGLEFCL
jgi:hypothetical protein